nr:hypothetical protein BaRGS_021144 [Batillaria attramentaria]
MLGEVIVNVDETQARLTLIEAHQKTSDNEMRAVDADLKDKNANLTQQVARLNQENVIQANQLSQYHLENVNLTNYVDNLQSELTLFHEAASKRVSFHAKLQTTQQVRDPNPVIMKTVLNNEGDFYNQSTPTGRQSSSKYQDGRFYLQLPNPVEGGEYSCILPSTDPATSCLPDGSLLEAALVVDEIKIRLTLLEAENTERKAAVKDLKAENTDLKAENTDMKAAVKDLKAEKADMKAAVKDLKAKNTDMKAAVKDLKAENTDLKAENTDMKAAVKDLKTLVNINTATLEAAPKRVVWLKAYDDSNYWHPTTVFSGFLLNADE